MLWTLEEDVAARIGNDKSKLEHNSTKEKNKKEVMALFQTQCEVRKWTF